MSRPGTNIGAVFEKVYFSYRTIGRVSFNMLSDRITIYRISSYCNLGSSVILTVFLLMRCLILLGSYFNPTNR